MKRRTAIKNIVLATAGATILPACFREESFPVYSNLPISKNQWYLIDQIRQAILPIELPEQPLPVEETVTHFLLTSLNDCYEPEVIEKYLIGFQEFQTMIQKQFLRDTTSSKLINIPDEHLNSLLNYITETNELPENQKVFFETTKGLAVRHFTSSEEFLKEKMDFEFAPGRFIGCVEI